MPGFEIIDNKEREALNDIFDRSNGVLFAHGFEEKRNRIFRVRDLEKAFGKRIGNTKAAACSSGTASIYIALKCLGIKPGDEVITQAFTFVATIEAIIAAGAIPVIVDIDDSYNMCPQSLEKAMNEKTKTVMPVHMLGNTCKMDEIIRVSKNIPIIEDACEALGAKYKGKEAGNIGHAGCFSFDFGKTITTGDGGMVVSKDEDFITQCLQFIDHGHICKEGIPRGMDDANIFGFNYRMTEMQGAVGLVQLEKLDYIVEQNRKNKAVMKNILSDVDGIKFRTITDREELADTLIFNLNNASSAQKAVQALSQAGIGTKILPDAMRWHFVRNFTQIWDNTGFYPNYNKEWEATAELLQRSIALPIMVRWTEEDCVRIATQVKDILHRI